MFSRKIIRHTALLALFLTPFSIAEQVDGMQTLTLNRAFQIALEHNHDLRLSAYGIANAAAATVIAAAAPNPNLTFQTFSINPAAGIGAGSLREKTVDSALRIDQLIERGDKRRLRTEAASHLENATRADLSETRRQLRLAVSQAYYDLLAAQERLVVSHETAALFDRTIGAAQKREKAGDIAGADVARIQVDNLRAKNDARQAESDLAKAQLTLALSMGITSTQSIHASDNWPPAVQPALDREIENLIEQRPDVRAAKARVDAAEAASRLARAARTRDVSVGLQFDHYPTSIANPQGSGNSYGVAVQIPLFIRYNYDGEIRTADIAQESARETLEKIKDLARNDLSGALENMRSGAERVERFNHELLGAAKASTEAAEYGFKSGAVSVMDVLDARRTYRAIELDAIAARAEYAKSMSAWQAAVSEEIQK